MTELTTELNELKQFVVDLKADRAAAKEKEQREAWTKYVSLTVVIIAVIAAIASQWAGKYSGRSLTKLNDATYFQSQASDQWSFYQAKSIKQNLYEVTRPQGGAGILPAGPGPRVNDPESERRAKDFEEKIARYDKEKKEIMDKAKALEAKRDEARDAAGAASEKGGRMGLAVAIFSISIALSSISMVTKKKPLWFVSMLMAVPAVIQMVLAWVK